MFIAIQSCQMFKIWVFWVILTAFFGLFGLTNEKGTAFQKVRQVVCHSRTRWHLQEHAVHKNSLLGTYLTAFGSNHCHLWDLQWKPLLNFCSKVARFNFFITHPI